MNLCNYLHTTAPTFSNSRVTNDIMETNEVTALITCESSVYGALGYCSVNFTTFCESRYRVEVQCCKFNGA